MRATNGALRTRWSTALDDRISVGVAVVLISVLLLPVALWLGVLVVVLGTDSRRPSGVVLAQPGPALRRWLTVGTGFVAAAALSMVGAPTTGHGLLLMCWFALMPMIGVLFLVRRRPTRATDALWIGVTLGAILAGVVATIQVAALDAPRATGVVANSITFGNLALLMGAVSVALHRVVDLPRRPATWAALTAAGCALTASILSGSRGGWLAAPLLIAGLLWQARSDMTPRRAAGLAAGLLAVVTLSNAAADGMPTNRASASVDNVAQYQPAAPRSTSAGSSEGARLEAWRSAADAFWEQPVNGIGWGNLAERFDRDAELGLRNKRIATFEHAHNQVIGAAASGGLIGVGMLGLLGAVPLVMFAKAARSPDRRRSAAGVAGVAVVGSYTVFGLTEAVLENLAPVTFLAVVVGVLCAELDVLDRAPESVGAALRPVRTPVASDARSRLAATAHQWRPPFGLHH